MTDGLRRLAAIRTRWQDPPMGWITKSEHEHAGEDIGFLLTDNDRLRAALTALVEAIGQTPLAWGAATAAMEQARAALTAGEVGE